MHSGALETVGVGVFGQESSIARNMNSKVSGTHTCHLPCLQYSHSCRLFWNDQFLSPSLEGKTSHVIENLESARTTPSVVTFTKNGKHLVGLPAKRQGVVNSQNTVLAFKRLIGCKFNDKKMKEDVKYWYVCFIDFTSSMFLCISVRPFKVIPTPDGRSATEV